MSFFFGKKRLYEFFSFADVNSPSHWTLFCGGGQNVSKFFSLVEVNPGGLNDHLKRRFSEKLWIFFFGGGQLNKTLNLFLWRRSTDLSSAFFLAESNSKRYWILFLWRRSFPQASEFYSLVEVNSFRLWIFFFNKGQLNKALKFFLWCRSSQEGSEFFLWRRSIHLGSGIFSLAEVVSTRL